MLRSVLLVVHMLVAVLIIGLVLLQRGKGADAGTGFGAGASATVFGARGSSNFLSRMTAVLVTVFFVTSMSLAFLAGQTSAPTSLLEQAAGAGTGPVVLPAGGDELPELPLPEPMSSAPAGGDELPELPLPEPTPSAPAGGGSEP